MKTAADNVKLTQVLQRLVDEHGEGKLMLRNSQCEHNSTLSCCSHCYGSEFVN